MPAWGTTRSARGTTRGTAEFQSTCPRGARPARGTTLRDTRYFNPRARVGHDAERRRASGAVRAISIHVPAWGTTSTRSGGRMWPDFNPRARVGHDRDSDPRWRRDRDFNPRARVGHDDFPAALILSATKFQSTCPRGARPGSRRVDAHPVISIHVPAWGTTLMSSLMPFNIRISIHVPAWGTTSIVVSAPVRVFPFQSTCPRGARRGRAGGSQAAPHISIHVPAWGTTFYEFYEFVS